MIRFACVCALVLFSGAAQAQSVKLAPHEINILLSGNTAVGVWEGTPYRQYFDPDGSTIYVQKNVSPTRGQWRVKGDKYQSIWPNDADWEGWFIMEFSGDWFWVSKKTPPTPFKVITGEHLIAE